MLLKTSYLRTLSKSKFFILIIPLLFACQLAGLVEPTPTSPLSPNPITPAAPTVEPAGIPDSRLTGVAVPLPAVSHEPFGSAESVPVNLPAVIPLIEPSPAQLTDVERYELGPDEFAQLGRDGYLVRPDRAGTTQGIYAGAGPFMLTVDMVLLSTAATHQQVLNSATAEFRPRQTYDMLVGLINQTQLQADAADTVLEEQAALKNLAIFTLAGRFFDEAWPVPPAVRALVDTELTLLSAEGEINSPLLNKTIRYADIWAEPDSSSRVSAWLLLASPSIEPTSLPSEQRLAAAQIELLLDIWSDRSVPAWHALYTVQQYRHGARGASVEDWLALAELGVSDDDFLATAAQLPRPIFEILPRPEPFHQQLFDQLVFNRVGVHGSPETAPATALTNEAGTIRAVPRVIDIAAAFGSTQALSQLESDGESGYAGWGAQMQAVQAGLGEQGGWPAAYTQDLLRSMQPLANLVADSYPAYMRSASWNSLAQWENLFLPSLSNLAFQNDAIEFNTAETLIVIEPRPEIYANLATQTRALAQGLAERQMLDQPNADRLLALESELLVLKTVAEKGLAAIRPTPEEADVVARTLSKATQVQPDLGWPVFSGPLGSLTARNTGVVPTLFVVFNGSDFVIVQGGRLQMVVVSSQ